MKPFEHSEHFSYRAAERAANKISRYVNVWIEQRARKFFVLSNEDNAPVSLKQANREAAAADSLLNGGR